MGNSESADWEVCGGGWKVAAVDSFLYISWALKLLTARLRHISTLA